MKIALWQQFSSNHSANYTVVGQFDSAKDAEAAGSKIRQSVAEIAVWYEQHKQSGVRLSPPEENLSQQYNFDWKQAVDWLRPFPRYFRPAYQLEPHEHVFLYDRLVFVHAPVASSTWQTGHQFANLIAAMGGQPYSNVFMGEDPDNQHEVFKNIGLELQCTAPTVAVAIEIQHQLEIQKWDAIPWLIFHPRYAALMNDLSPDSLRTAEQIWLREHQAWAAFVQAHSSTDPEWKSKWGHYITQDEFLDDAIGHLRTDTSLPEASASRHEQVIELKISSVYRIDTFLPALVTWMRTQACSVDYQLYQTEAA